jgi:putative peptidoglycan lipid II flippase
MARSSGVMAVGTLFSRGTGFVRNIVLAASLGVVGLANAYNVGNTLPNIVYDLLLGGVLSAVIVPIIVEATKQDGDGGEEFSRSLLTLAALALLVTSVVAVLLAPLLVQLYLIHTTAAERSLAVEFSRYFLPQIFFYGVGAVIGAILNVRGRFGPPMWTPVLNNLVVIVVGGLFLVTTSRRLISGARVTTGEVAFLGIGTTLGIVAQTVALLPALRRSGFRFRPRLVVTDRLRRAVRLSGWVLAYVLTNQLALLVVINLADAIRGQGTGYTSYLYAYTLFQLPFAVVSVSIITALLPRMSAGAVAADVTALRADLSTGLRLTAVVLIPVAAGLLVLGPAIATLVFGWGRTTVPEARYIGFMLSGFAIGLVPFSAFQLQARAFYAMQDTRTPALINLWATAVNVVADLVLFFLLPNAWRVTGLAIGFSVSYLVAMVLAAARLSPRLGRAKGPRIVQAHVRLGVAALVGAAVALVVEILVRRFVGAGHGAAALTVLVGAGIGLALFVRLASALDTAELREVAALLTGRAGGRTATPRT